MTRNARTVAYALDFSRPSPSLCRRNGAELREKMLSLGQFWRRIRVPLVPRGRMVLENMNARFHEEQGRPECPRQTGEEDVP